MLMTFTGFGVFVSIGVWFTKAAVTTGNVTFKSLS